MYTTTKSALQDCDLCISIGVFYYTSINYSDLILRLKQTAKKNELRCSN